MIDALYNYRQGDIHSDEFSDEFNKLCIPFENLLSYEQIDVFHKMLDNSSRLISILSFILRTSSIQSNTSSLVMILLPLRILF